METENAPINVLIAENNIPFRQAVCAWLKDADGVAVIGEAQDEFEALELARERRPDVVLLDVSLLHANGSEQAAQIGKLYPDSKVIVLSTTDQDLLVLKALKEGAVGYLIKEECLPHEIIEAICAVSRGEAVLTPRMLGGILDEMAQRGWGSWPKTSPPTRTFCSYRGAFG
jgi:DNA-binding NarL/FixJ family response regulator